MTPRPPFPPFDEDTARQKVQAAEDAWNTRDPERVSLAYTEDSVWRNRDQHVVGRAEIVEFLTREVGARAGLRAAQGAVGLPRQPHRRPLPVRVPQRGRPVVPQLRQRAVGVQRRGPDATARSEHQRRPDRRSRTAASSARARSPSTACCCRSSESALGGTTPGCA